MAFDKKTFGARFGAALQERGFSQAEAARRIGVNPYRMSEWVSGKHTPPLPRLMEFVELLNLDIRTLFPEGKENRPIRRMVPDPAPVQT